ncbi:SprT-like domain-containing protein, putative [Plasmodium ovale]|uniref:SprT-like domain-containing protein, putative n=1 Tax=Plasmodium ovale TaxID=36330 RepID=A0A1D3TK93_PLAOA|nr:SprT-like domain-containing protein, putative [Plasmodium ovale]
MDGEITKLTSVENEYLQKSGKKRRQKSLIDVSSLNDVGDEHKTGSFPDISFSSAVNVSSGEPKKSCGEVSTELHSESGDDEEEDPDTQAVLRQLSSIQIESDRESSSSDNEKIDKDKRDDKKGNDTDMVAFNKKENINSKKEKKKKKGGEKKGAVVYEPFDVECVEDAVVYDESKDTEFPDLQELFCEYNARYFFDKLKSVQVKWSNKMKLCAGICVYKKSGYCCIRLSLPLLKLRKIKEYRETLLHEMIHAFLFLTRSNSKHDGHGPEFKKHMYRINRATGLYITIYHSFHKEVNFYRNHVWRCTGVCRTFAPHFGYVKRSMNRPPGPKEKWWRRHASYCCGKFVKIEQVNPGKKGESGESNQKEITNHPLEKGVDWIKSKNKRNKDTSEKRADNIDEDVINDAIIILDSKDFSDKRMNEEEDTDDMHIINLVKTLFSDNKDNVLSFPNITIDYHKAFEGKNYFEID